MDEHAPLVYAAHVQAGCALGMSALSHNMDDLHFTGLVTVRQSNYSSQNAVQCALIATCQVSLCA